MYNLAENEDNNTEEVFRDFVRNKLGVEKSIAIQRVHRLGARRMARDGNNKPRPMIAGLRDYPDVDICITRAKELKGTRLGISRNYPEKIRRARKQLEPKRRAAAQYGKRATVAYPAKLVVDNQVVETFYRKTRNTTKMMILVRPIGILCICAWNVHGLVSRGNACQPAWISNRCLQLRVGYFHCLSELCSILRIQSMSEFVSATMIKSTQKG